jgi:colicin import membrane protein
LFSRLTFKSSLLSILLHVAAVLLLVLSFDFTSRQVKPAPQVNAVEAVTVDSAQVEKELQRLKELEDEMEQQKLEKQRLLERQAREAETKRKTEEQRLADLKKKKEQEQKALEAEQKKVAEKKKEQEELERKRKAEADKQRQDEEAKKKAEAEQKKRKEEEAARQKQVAEQKAAEQKAAQARADQSLMQGVIANIYQDVRNNFNISGLPPGLECVLLVRTVPGGEVVGVQISKSSGNEIFDRRAHDAVQKASPLPLPADSATFERLGLRQFNLRFKPQ